MFSKLSIGLLAAAVWLPIQAVEVVNPFNCAVESGFLLIATKSSSRGAAICYANSGDLDVELYDVSYFSSGNNAGFFEYAPGDGYWYQHSFGKQDQFNDNGGKGWGLIGKIHID
nr:hypothetical protein [Calcarisporium cordycipiticola]